MSDRIIILDYASVALNMPSLGMVDRVFFLPFGQSGLTTDHATLKRYSVIQRRAGDDFLDAISRCQAQSTATTVTSMAAPFKWRPAKPIYRETFEAVVQKDTVGNQESKKTF